MEYLESNITTDKQKESMFNIVKFKETEKEKKANEEEDEEEKNDNQRQPTIAENLLKDEEDEEENNDTQNNHENNEKKQNDEKNQKKKGIKILMQNKDLKKNLIPGLKNTRKIKKIDGIKIEEEKNKKRDIGIYEIIGINFFFII